MYIKIINPATNGKNVYSNKGSARQAANYLQGEAKKQGETAVFFNSDRADISGDEAVSMLDSNRKGLRKDDMKFYSLVVSPGAQELEHLGHDPQKLQAYTARVMHEYAANFATKSGQPFGAKDVVWVATQHDERKHRGHNGAPSGQLKEGPQTHIHIMVSARDKEQRSTLNPLGSAARFNRVDFMAKGIETFDDQFGFVKQRSHNDAFTTTAKDVEGYTARAPYRRRTQTVAEIAESIRRRAAEKGERAATGEANHRNQKTPRIRDAVRDKQLFNQVDKVNKLLPADRQLEHTKVLEAARKLNDSKPFYGRLGQLGKEAEGQRYHDLPYEFLRTGQDAKTVASTLAEHQQRDKRILEQVDRLNKKVSATEKLVPNIVLGLAREQEYSKVFYGRLSRIGREAQGPKYIREPHEFLRTGRIPRAVQQLPSEQYAPPAPPNNPVQSRPLPAHTPSAYSRAGNRITCSYQPSTAHTAAEIGYELGRVLGAQGYTQSVRGDEERE